MADAQIEFDRAAAAELAARLLSVVQDAPAETMLLASMAIAQLSAACVAAELGLAAPQVFAAGFSAAADVLHQATSAMAATRPEVS